MTLLFMALLALTTLLLGVSSPAAAEAGQINGTMTSNGQPIPGVAFEVTNNQGFVANASSGADGKWRVAIPGAGQYVVTIDPATLPEGVALTNPDKTQLTINLLSSAKTVSFPTGVSSNEVESKVDRFWQLLVDGLVFGLVLGLAGVGLSLIFGTTGLTNFAHGELITLGAIMTLVFNNFLGLPFVIAAVLSLASCAIFGALQDFALWRQLRRKGISLIAMLVVSIGLGILLRYMYLFFMGGNTQQYASYSGQAGLTFGSVDITPKAIVGSAVAIVAIGATLAWLGLSKNGKASRAISDNPALASASGINVERVINLVWILGASLAGLAGIIYSMSVGVNWQQGFQMLLIVFASVVLGGLGTAVGALVGSLVVGVMIQVSTLFIPTEMKTVGALVIMILILLVRPQGILGRSERVG